MTCKNAWCNLV